MYGYFGTTVIQAGLLTAAILTFGQISGRWLETTLFFVSLALVISVIRPNQMYHWLEKRPGVPISHLPGMWVDMTQRVVHRERHLIEARQAAQTQLVNLHQALSSLDAGLVHLSTEWKIDWWNAPATRLLGLRESSDTDAALFNLVRTPELIRYVEEDDFELPITLPSPIATGRMLEYTVCPIRSSGYLLVVRDVTRFTRLERMRSDFVANVSHELKTPLTVITGYLETILDNELVSNQGVRAVEQAIKQAGRMNQLLQDLLLLSQLETTAPDPKPIQIHVQDILEHAVREANELKKALQRERTQIQISQLIEADILGDWNELTSAINNLACNAVRYSADGADINLRFELRDGQGVITVKDNGPGILPEHLPRLTERFYRVDNSHSPATGGTGLGLAIVKHILLRHGGSLEIDSQPGQGSEFRCVLPSERIAAIKSVAASA